MKSRKVPAWLVDARAHATDYLHRFAFNPGVELIVGQFDTKFKLIKDADKRLDYLKGLAAEHWDFRKGRERYEVTESFDMDEPGNDKGKIIFEGSAIAEMGVSSKATLKHYSIMAILGGANLSPYNRLKYGLEQEITYDLLAYLGSERELPPAEKEAVKEYAKGAQTEFDLGKGAIVSLMNNQLTEDEEGDYEIATSEWRMTRLLTKQEVPVFLLSAPPYLGGRRANTADTYDLLRRIEQEALTPVKNILFITGSIYRYAQYFDAMREICLRTGTDIETIGYDPPYMGKAFKPTEFLQELKAAADAAVRLRDAVNGKEELNEWRKRYYNRFTRNEADHPGNHGVNQKKVND